MAACIIKPIPGSTGIAVILPSPTFKDWELHKRSRNYYDESGTGLFHHVGGGEVITFEELEKKFLESTKQKEEAI